ncbi:MAG: hypothetical protein WCV70_03105 [Patescibacteria group bacterium]
MKKWISLPDALEMDPQFQKKSGASAWVINEKTGEINSRWGKVAVQVQLKNDGNLDFGRGVYYEPPNINAVVYGFEADGTCKVGITIQERPFANNPPDIDNPYGTPADSPIKFGQPVMGFLKKIIGDGAAASIFESTIGGATREALEEVGATAEGILEVKPFGEHYPNPTFCATTSRLIEIKIDLKKVTGQTDKEELIYKAEYISLKELFCRIGKKVHDGVNYNAAVANNTFFMWLAKHPELLSQLT